MRTAFVVLFFFSISLYAFGQNNQAATVTSSPDTIIFNNGRVLAAHVVDTSGDKITIEKLNSSKHKKIEVDREGVFSIVYGSTHKEIVIYIYDTIVGHDFTVADARLFIAGEQDAQKGFHARAVIGGAFLIGLASGAVSGSIIAFLPPFLYAGLMSYPRIHIRHKSVKNLDNVKQDPYLYGYDNTARRKRTIRSFIWGGIGLVTGLTLNFTGVEEKILNSIDK